MVLVLFGERKNEKVPGEGLFKSWKERIGFIGAG